jgi:hypothetical protein
MATKKKIITDTEWLNSEPLTSEVELSPYGGRHIPIDKLKPILDKLNWGTANYKTTLYTDGYANKSACGSIELTVIVDGVVRTVTGAYNLLLSEAPNGFWNGTLKSECIKNAAKDLGKRFGRDLNDDLPKEQLVKEVAVKNTLKAKPDSKIMKQFLTALEKGDEATIITLKNIYEINYAPQEQNI